MVIRWVNNAVRAERVVSVNRTVRNANDVSVLMLLDVGGGLSVIRIAHFEGDHAETKSLAFFHYVVDKMMGRNSPSPESPE